MAGTLRVVMRSRSAWPDQTVTIVVAPEWTSPMRCTHDPQRDVWVSDDLEVTQVPQGQGLVLKFRCDGAWNDPQGDIGNIAVPAEVVLTAKQSGAAVEYEVPTSVTFPSSAPPSALTSPAYELFRPDWNPQQEWDYIVIGSGMGGGVLAHELTTRSTSRPPKVLVLEQGGYLFPTHVGNLPRRHSPSRNVQVKSIWDLYWTYRKNTYEPAGNTPEAIDVSTADTFGGRSVFWGSSAPRLSQEELQRWPDAVRTDLAVHYPAAEQLFRVAGAPDSPYQQAVRTVLHEQLDAFTEHEPAPMAVEYRRDDVLSAIPTGVFSTAALLLEDLLQWDSLTEGDRWGALSVHLNERVVDFDLTGTRIGAVQTRNTVTGEPRTYRVAPGGRVILAAGSVASPALALDAGLTHPNLGRGLTDHPIFVVKFLIPEGTHFSPVQGDLLPPSGAPQSSKTLSRRSGRQLPGGRGYNVLLELGAAFNQSRFGSEVELARVVEHEGDDPGSWCEASFLLDVDLIEENSVTIGSAGQTVVRMDRAVTDPTLRTELEEHATKIVGAFGGQVRDAFAEMKMGGVGHECGSMRMGTTDESVVDVDLKLRGHDNVYVCDLSVFPTSPASNPSLTLAALALRLAGHLLHG